MNNTQRWMMLMKTSPSGKTLYVCTICGRTSVAPDKDCPEFTVVVGNGEVTTHKCQDVESTWCQSCA